LKGFQKNTGVPSVSFFFCLWAFDALDLFLGRPCDLVPRLVSHTPPLALPCLLRPLGALHLAPNGDAGAEHDAAASRRSAVLVPNAVMMLNHARGGSPAVFNFVIKNFGVHGLFALPAIGLVMEKSWYDTAMCLQGIDPSKVSDDRRGEGFPSGGHNLPSLSLVSLRERPITLHDIVPAALMARRE